MLQVWHRRFSRFDAGSEISRLNRDPADRVAASPLMRRMVQVALQAARDTGGLVDATLADEIERAGYATHLEPVAGGLEAVLRQAPPRGPARPAPDELWRRVAIDRATGEIVRPAGLRIDVGGIAKGVFADELSATFQDFDAYAIDCAGDVRVGGRARSIREVRVTDPFSGLHLRTVRMTAGSAATSGIGRRRWIGEDGRPAHHILDPSTAAPAFTGVVQATALAPTAAEAEVLAKAALLSGPERAAEWLVHGGLVVLDDATIVESGA
jgi:thiamine biosynthesis lipoprotein